MKIGSAPAKADHLSATDREHPDYFDGWSRAINGAAMFRGERSANYEAGWFAAHSSEVFFGECFGMVGAVQ